MITLVKKIFSYLVFLVIGIALGVVIGYFAFKIDENTYVLKSDLKDFGIRYNLSTAFLRDLFPNEIVYLDNGQVTFIPIDPELSLHEYDWRNLVNIDGRLDYRLDDKSLIVAGIDVSKFQGNIDWSKVKQEKIDFAMLRVGYRGYTEGEIFIDSQFHEYALGASQNGIDLGVYFFSQAINEAEAIEEANFVLQQIVDYSIAYPVVFDMEDIFNTTTRTDGLSKNDITKITKAFCLRIKEAGYTPMIYGNSHWFFSNLNLEEIKDIDKWYAQYASNPYYPYAFSIWQYTNSGQIDGIKGNVDLNISFVDYAN